MKLSTTLAALLCANAALAAVPRLAEKRHERREARRLAALNRKTRLPQNVTDQGYIGDSSGNANVQYSSNWAGAAVVSTGCTSVTGTATVPTPKEPPGGNSNTEYAASAWVGIDGYTCESAVNYPNFDVSAGDQIQMTVTASGKNGGTASVINLTTGQKASHTFTDQSASLCETNAEWIVEDFESDNSLVPFADFGTITFTDASAQCDGSTVDPGSGTIIDLRQNNQVLASCSASGNEVSCTYE